MTLFELELGPETGAVPAESVADSPKVHYGILQEIAGQETPIGAPIDTEAKELWLRIEDDDPGVVGRFIERVFGEHDSGEVPAFWEDKTDSDDSQH
jgi:hypothetical protein